MSDKTTLVELSPDELSVINQIRSEKARQACEQKIVKAVIELMLEKQRVKDETSYDMSFDDVLHFLGEELSHRAAMIDSIADENIKSLRGLVSLGLSSDN